MSVAYLQQNEDAPETSFKLILPTKLYTLRCIEATFGKSKVRTSETGEQTGGNPMITLDWEVVSPESVTIKEKDANGIETKVTKGIQGLRVRDYITLTARAAAFIKARCIKLGIDPATLDDETPNFLQFEGKTDTAILGSKADFAVDSETGGFIIIPSTGERKVDYRHKVVEWV